MLGFLVASCFYGLPVQRRRATKRAKLLAGPQRAVFPFAFSPISPNLSSSQVQKNPLIFLYLLQLFHSRFVCLPSTFDIGPMPITILCVALLGFILLCILLTLRSLRRVLFRDVLRQKRSDALFNVLGCIRWYSRGKKLWLTLAHLPGVSIRIENGGNLSLFRGRRSADVFASVFQGQQCGGACGR